MKRIHLLCHDGGPEALAPLFEAARREGLRVGWLDLAAAGEEAVPPALGPALEGGAFRAAAVAPGRTVAAKARSGPPVLRDLLREHFLGCALVVVRPAGGGEAHPELEGAPRLEAEGGRFRVVPPAGAALELSADALAGRLRRPRPWG